MFDTIETDICDGLLLSLVSGVVGCSMKYTASDSMSNSPLRPLVESHVALYPSGLDLID